MTKAVFRKLCLAVVGLLGCLTAGHAHAACSGKNLWPEFAEKYPQAALAADAAARAVPFGEGRLFRLSKPGKPVSYVLGTIHLKDARYQPLSGAIRRAFDATTVTVLELETVKEAAMAKMAAAGNPEFIAALFAESGERPIDFLSAEEQAQVNAVGEAAGIPGSYLLTMRPVLLAAALPLTVCRELGKAEDGVDGELEQLSLERAKLVIGLETMLEQFAAFNNLPFDVQKAVLQNSLRSLENVADALETLKQFYVEGRTGLLLLGMKGEIPELKTMGEPNPLAFTIAIVDERNRRMVKRALPLLEINSTFVAVGAAHLPGEVGILKLFQDAGYTVEKVE